MNKNKIIYTSYFSSPLWKGVPVFQPISIALKTPAGFAIPTSTAFMPPESLKNSYKYKGLSDYEYKVIYTRERLQHLQQKDIDRLFKISNNRIPVLLCYEASEDFCHRHLVAEDLNNRGYMVRELTKDIVEEMLRYINNQR